MYIASILIVLAAVIVAVLFVDCKDDSEHPKPAGASHPLSFVAGIGLGFALFSVLSNS